MLIDTSPPSHFISALGASKDFCQQLFERTNYYRAKLDADLNSCRNERLGRIAVLWFRQPSTRTYMSFFTACLRLGMSVIPVIDPTFSSEYKGESEDHSMRTAAGYQPNLLVIRHNRVGGVREAVESISKTNWNVPIINAGDGKGEHPTQATLDVYTLLQFWGEGKKPDLSGARIAIGGDLQGRVPRSLALLLAEYGPEIIFISPPELRMGDDVKARLRSKGVTFREEQDIASAFSDADYYYWTRIQNDQRTDAEREALKHIHPLDYQLRREHLRHMREGVKIFHPMPINRRPGEITEIEPEIDDLSVAAYWPQSANGVPHRMGIIAALTA